MSEVLIDITRLLGRLLKGRLPTGVDRVSLAYLRHFEQKAQALVRWIGQDFVLSREDSGRIFRLLLSPTVNFNRDAWILLGKGMACGWKTRETAGKFLFNTGHSGLERDAYPAMVKQREVRPLFFVHDLIPITHPEYCRPGEGERHEKRMKTVLDLAAGVIANSQSTLDELARFSCGSGNDMPPAVVAPLAPGMTIAPSRSRPVGPPYFVMLGTVEPRKNHWLMLQLWRRLIERHGDNAPKLILIGQRGWECENVVDLLERCEILRGFVEEHSACADAVVASYLHHAQALLFPSFAEGYGMPLVEALSLGTPVIASDLPAFREIAGDIPEYLDPLDGKRWGEMVEEFSLPQSQMRAWQLQRMADFRVPTWPDHFSRVDGLMERLSESAR